MRGYEIGSRIFAFTSECVFVTCVELGAPMTKTVSSLLIFLDIIGLFTYIIHIT